MNTVLNHITTHPRKTIVVFMLFTVFFATGISKIVVKNSFDGELPTDDPINQQIDAVKEIYGERSIVLVGLLSDDFFQIGELEKVTAWTEKIKQIPYVLTDEVKSLSTVENISKRSWGLSSGSFLDELPTSTKEFNQLQSDIASNQLVAGKLISHDGTLAVVVAPLEDDFDGPEVYDALNMLKQADEGVDQIILSGPPILVEDVQRGISADSKRFIAIAVILIFFGFYICFRSLSGVILPLIMVVMSIIWTMGTMGFLGLNITVVSNALPVIMIAVASSYGIHFMNALYTQLGAGKSKLELVQATIDKIGMPIFITGLTSALGSFSLLVFKIKSLQEFGIIGAVGFAYAAFICLIFLPAACMLWRFSDVRNVRGLSIKKLTLALANFGIKHRLQAIGLYVVIIPFSIYQASQIKIGDDYIKFFPTSHQGRIAAETFSDKLGGIRVMDVVVDTKKEDGIKDISFYQSFTDFEGQLTALDNVGSLTSYSGLIAHLKKSFGDPSTLVAAEEIPQYLMLHEMSSNPGELASYYDEDYKTAKIQLLLSTSAPEIHKRLHGEIKALAEAHFRGDVDVSFGGDVMHRISLGNYIVSGKIMNIIVALCIVFLATIVLFRSLKKTLQTLLPIVVSLIMIFGLMGLLGIRMGISTSLLTAMVVGIGIDFAIHYLVAYYKSRSNDQESAIYQTNNDTGQAIGYDAMSNIIGFSVLSFSGFVPVQHFGWLLAFSMLLIFINTLTLYPILFSTSRINYSLNSNTQLLTHQQ